MRWQYCLLFTLQFRHQTNAMDFSPVCSALERDNAALFMFQSAGNLLVRADFVDFLREITGNHAKSNDQLFCDFSSYCHRSLPLSNPVRLAAVKVANDNRARRLHHKNLARTLRLNFDEAKRERLLNGFRIIEIPVNTNPYPPPGHIIYESKTTHDLWFWHFTFGKQPDKRHKRKPMHQVDDSKLIADIGEDESALIYRGGRLVGVVMRNFCSSREVLEAADNVVLNQTGVRKNIRVSSTTSIGG